MDAIVIASGIPDPEDPMYVFVNGDAKALVDVAGKPMIQWVLDALGGAKRVDNVILVGLSAKTPLTCTKPLYYVSNQGRMLANIVVGVNKALELNKKNQYVLVVSSDIPALKPEMVDWLIDTCMETKDDLYYGICPREVMEARFPNSRRTYTHLKDMDVCGAGINVTHVRMTTEHLDMWEPLISTRKSPLGQASIIGLSTLFALFTRRLTLEDAVTRVCDRIGIKGRAIVWSQAEPCMNVDKPHQLELLREDLAKQQRKSAARAKSTAKKATRKTTKSKPATKTVKKTTKKDFEVFADSSEPLPKSKTLSKKIIEKTVDTVKTILKDVVLGNLGKPFIKTVIESEGQEENESRPTKSSTKKSVSTKSRKKTSDDSVDYKKADEIPVIKKKPLRVLNGNFADPMKKGSFQDLNKSLLADHDYDLRVDVGPRWAEQSLFGDDTMTVFPQRVIEAKLLTPEDRQWGSYDVQVVFISEAFTPHVVAGLIKVPLDVSQRSIPYIKNRLAKKADSVRLRIRTPQLPAENAQSVITVDGRLSLYYRNNLLQSAAIRAGISAEADIRLEEPNKGQVDFLLTEDFRGVAKTLGVRRVKIGQEGKPVNIPVAANITLNDNGSGGHRIIVKHYDNRRNKDVLPVSTPYDPLSAIDDLKEFRALLKNCHEGLNEDLGKSLQAFKKDLQAFAILGYKLRKNAFANMEVEGEQTGTAWWISLQHELAGTSIIQVARAGSATYAFPWALIYQYPMRGPNYRFCKSLDEWSKDGVRKHATDRQCPYENDPELNHFDGNVVCPYGFWGLKHIIEQPLLGGIPENVRPREIKKVKTSQAVQLGIAVTDVLEKPMLKLRDKHLEYLAGNRSFYIAPQKPARTLREALEMMRAPEIVYFLCHGEYHKRKDKDNKEQIDEPYLSIGSGKGPDYWIDTGIWVDYASAFDNAEWSKRKPLVFINGCHTTAVRPGVVLNFVSVFKQLGANAVIGTEVSLWVDVAIDAGQIILGQITQGETIGDAIRSMRWALLNKGNFLGLAYTPYCLADLRVVKR